MATKFGRMIASLDGLLPIMSHGPLITWPCETGGSRTRVGSARKRLSRHQLLVSDAGGWWWPTKLIIGSLEPWQLKNKFKGIFFLLIKENKHDKQTNTRKLKLLIQGRCSAKIIFQSLTALKLLSNTFGKQMLRANMDSRTTLMNFFLRSFWSIFQIYLNTGKQLYLQMQT